MKKLYLDGHILISLRLPLLSVVNFAIMHTARPRMAQTMSHHSSVRGENKQTETTLVLLSLSFKTNKSQSG